jgi:heme exporter protein A
LSKKTLLEIINLHFDYYDKLFLQDIHLALSAGGLLHLRGANGAGKTTLLRLIAGLFEADSGDILINGVTLFEDPIVYKQQLCFISHKLGLNPYLTVAESVRYDLQRLNPIEDLTLLLEQFNLQNLAKSRCGNLSAGQQRRVALLRLVLSKAKLWLLDEPFVALDETNIALLTSQIIQHRDSGGAIVLTSHQTLPSQLSEYQEYQL